MTSSNSSGVGISSGSGVPGRYLNRIDGSSRRTAHLASAVVRFPSEQDNATGSTCATAAMEYGTVTRRPRRCGWFDAVAVRYTARLSGVECQSVMLLDVLSELDEIQVARLTRSRPASERIPQPRRGDTSKAQPVYEDLPAGGRISFTCEDGRSAQRGAGLPGAHQPLIVDRWKLLR